MKKNSEFFLHMLKNENYPFDVDLWTSCCKKEGVVKPKRGTEEHETVLKVFREKVNSPYYKQQKKWYYTIMYKNALKMEEEAQQKKEMFQKRFSENPNWEQEEKAEKYKIEQKQRESISWGW